MLHQFHFVVIDCNTVNSCANKRSLRMTSKKQKQNRRNGAKGSFDHQDSIVNSRDNLWPFNKQIGIRARQISMLGPIRLLERKSLILS